MYKITMIIPHLDNRRVEMPGDHNLSLREAVMRVGLYSKKNPDVEFEIEEES